MFYNYTRLTLTDCIDNDSGITDFTCNDGTCIPMIQRCDLKVGVTREMDRELKSEIKFAC